MTNVDYNDQHLWRLKGMTKKQKFIMQALIYNHISLVHNMMILSMNSCRLLYEGKIIF